MEKILIGALVTLIVAVFQQAHKNRNDAFNARIDEFCKLVFEAADCAAEYWILSKRPSSKTDGTVANQASIRLTETRIAGFQQKINLFFAVVRPYLRTHDSDSLSALLAEFFDAMTGGDFGAKARATDETRAALVYTNGSEVVARLRRTKPSLPLTTIILAIVVSIVAVLFFYSSSIKVLPIGWVKV